MHEAATEELHVIAYVMLPRARLLQCLRIMQPFGQQLFPRGPPAGPHILMRKLRGELDVQNVASEFSRRQEGRITVAAKGPMDALHQYAQCFLFGSRGFMAFGACTSQEVWSRITVHGS